MSIVFAILTGLSTALALWQWVCGLRFPVHRRSRRVGPMAPVTLLKPLKGWDVEARTCLASWLHQDYAAPVQMLLGVDEDDEAARRGAQELIQALPEDRAKLVLCHRRLGPHPKVAKLAQLYPHAAHDLLVVSDADIWAPPDFLAETVPALARSEVGMLNCFYCQPRAQTLAMRWLSVAINADFWAQVLQSNSLKPQNFALGAVMMIRRGDLEAIGGFTSYIGYLADDYQLGHRITRLGKRIELSPVVVECRSAPMGWGEVWRHQLRQSRTIRACEPVPYFFSILGNVTLWCVCWGLASPSGFAAAGIGVAMVGRILTALYNERRLCPQASAPWRAWMIPIKDLLQFAVWAGAFLGSKVHWRGEWFRVRAGGQLERLTQPSSVSEALSR